jgi:hypothetical protein
MIQETFINPYIKIICLLLLTSPLFAERYDFDITKNEKVYEVILFQTDNLPKIYGYESDPLATEEAKEWYSNNNVIPIYNFKTCSERRGVGRRGTGERMSFNQLHTIITVIYGLYGMTIPDNCIENDPNYPNFTRFKNGLIGTHPEIFMFRYAFFIREKGSNNSWVYYRNSIESRYWQNYTYNSVNKLLYYSWDRYNTRLIY